MSEKSCAPHEWKFLFVLLNRKSAFLSMWVLLSVSTGTDKLYLWGQINRFNLKIGIECRLQKAVLGQETRRWIKSGILILILEHRNLTLRFRKNLYFLQTYALVITQSMVILFILIHIENNFSEFSHLTMKFGLLI